DAEFRHDSGYE
nr:Chain D, Amyloid beta A4 protein [Homo sapiens]5CSZ_E Chain E, Amyloid beta A4 protein [Homo sapiens]6CO3_Q Chain Q, ALA-GLU-PHE-ARG-HIS-ASP [Homo sapiens]